MRKLMLFTIGFTCACVIGTYFFSKWIWLLLVLGLSSIVVIGLFRKRFNLQPLAVVAFGLCAGVLWFGIFQYFYLSSASNVDGLERSLTAQITDYSVSTKYGVSVKGTITLDGKNYPAVLYLKNTDAIKPGDLISGTFRLRMTHEGLQGDTYHRGSGIFLLAYATDEVSLQEADKVSARYFPAMIRSAIANRLELLFSEDCSGFVKALLLGDRTDIDYETSTSFKVSGISHIIAVSGLHVSILYSVIFQIAWRKRSITAIIGIPTLILFAAITGFTPSVTRACVMQILFMLADTLLKEYDPPTALSASVLLMLIINPISVSSVSLQLSAGCMIGIIVIYPKVYQWISGFFFWKSWKGKTTKVRFRNWFASGVAVTISSMFFTTPFVAYYFGCVSLIGALTNLVTLWAVSWIFYGAMLVCILSLFWYQLAALLAWIVGWLIRYVLTVSKVFAGFPLAAVYTKSVFIVAWIVVVYLLAIAFILRKKRRPYFLICSITISLATSVLLSAILPLSSHHRMTVLDVGQGQSVILQSRGKTFLIDCGGDSPETSADLAAETLLSMGVFRLDGIILTHYDGDHALGIPYLLSRVSADNVYLPEQADDEDLKQSVLDAAGDAAVLVRNDIDLKWNNSTLSVFAPVFNNDDNESGLSVLFRGENCDILITGDLGISGENKLVLEKNLPQLTALIAGHHGSPYSTGASLLAVTKPQYVFISVGKNNPYGHPNEQVLDRLKQYGCTIYRTDQDGTIVFRR